MPTGRLRVDVTTAEEAMPIPFARVTIHDNATGQDQILITDISGQTPEVSFEAPDARFSLDPNYTGAVYSTVTVRIDANEFFPAIISDVQIFAGKLQLLPAMIEPVPAGVIERTPQVYPIPEHMLRTGEQTSMLVPPEGLRNRVLDRAVVPDVITVHLGRPTSSAQNVTVTFPYYIKNVCCSEIYVTWPDASLRANIYCQISLALNRIFTEWYRNQNYNFDITNSTSFDQNYVHNRQIDSNVSNIVDGIFDQYIRKSNFVEPFYAEYCNGTTVSNCPGLKQWGTVTLANQGYTPLNILRYYYGNLVNLATAEAVKGIQQSYPGTALRRGSTGPSVAALQTWLLRIRQNYPAITNLGTADGVFGANTESAVRAFQRIFSLTQDGVVGRTTWNRISRIFVAIKKLAELGSEGIVQGSVPGNAPNTTIRQGSTGETVRLAQFLLNASQMSYPELYVIAVDSIFGTGTFVAVQKFQAQFNLTADGVVGPLTWAKLYDVGLKALATFIPANPVYPGTLLRQGSSGANVRTMQTYLAVIARNFSAIPTLAIDGAFGSGTAATVRAFQNEFGLTADGIIGPATWRAIVNAYNALG